MRRLWHVLSLPVLLVACEVPSAPVFLRRETLFVAATTVPCEGVAPQTCLQVRRTAAAPWSLLYDGIEGFAHEAGYEYELEVAVFRVARPPADGSSTLYRLLRQVKRVSAPPPR